MLFGSFKLVAAVLNSEKIETAEQATGKMNEIMLKKIIAVIIMELKARYQVHIPRFNIVTTSSKLNFSPTLDRIIKPGKRTVNVLPVPITTDSYKIGIEYVEIKI
jgi:hypothetical protein